MVEVTRENECGVTTRSSALRSFHRPPTVDPRHDPLRNRDCICNGRLQSWRRPPVPMGELPSGKYARRDQQDALSAFVHGSILAFSSFVRPWWVEARNSTLPSRTLDGREPPRMLPPAWSQSLKTGVETVDSSLRSSSRVSPIAVCLHSRCGIMAESAS